MNRPETNRRNFLRAALAAGALAVADGPRALARAGVSNAAPLSLPGLLSQGLQTRRFAPVKVARNRIIRTIVGLRPYRDEGFVVDAERLGDKLLVHDYGHGGAGVTLSWGTSSLAVDIARDFLQTRTLPNAVTRGARPLTQGVLTRPPRLSRRSPLRFAVLGCGVIGLSTARLLQRRLQGEGASVTIYAKNLPPQTTSNIAGAWWSPTSVYDSQMVSAKFLEQFRLSCQISNRAFQELVGPEYGVRWIDSLELITREAQLTRELAGGNALYPQVEIHRDPEQYFGFPYVRQFSSMLIEPHTYLRALLRDFYVAGGKVVVKEFKKREEIARLSEQVVFNCTGLGARDLFDDQKLGPVRGQLEVLLPQAEIDYCYISGSGYMFPRRDGIILGGTFDHDDWSLEPNAGQTNGILEGHIGIMRGLTAR
ncbi:MAG TPA: FAD-dependent oxidoreductase [Pyrinomonadaceae bacterium]|nr:FAD-dependent oxidoreductase [Pyrinomonadaceae bacterium]